MTRRRSLPGRRDFGRSLLPARRGAVALLFAIMAVPLLGLTGIAIDYTIWIETYATLSLAANAAAMNAAKVAVNAYLQNDSNYAAEGAASGKQWFVAELGASAIYLNATAIAPVATISVNNITLTAKVSYTGAITSVFGKLFAQAQYPIAVEADTVIDTAPYLNVEILLDNSPSMEIGATPGDIAAMMYLTPCSTPGAIYGETAAQNAAGNWSGWSPAGQYYNAYQCVSGATYDGTNFGAEACPISGGVRGTSGTLQPANTAGGPACSNLPQQSGGGANGQRPLAGAPCAFACHFDTTDPLSAGNDYYGIARSTIGKPACYTNGASPGNCAITLRFDLVKNAVNGVIAAMQTQAITSVNNLNVGIFTFDTAVRAVYPPASSCGATGSVSCQAGHDWTTATSLVGAPPTSANTLDTGIQPYTGGNGGDTDLPNVLTSLAGTYLTAAGNGTSAASPVKVLFIVTDGFADYVDSSGSRVYAAINPTQCQAFKTMGYTVYVVYTPFYPLMNGFYLSTNYSIVEGSGSGSLAYNLQQCASDPVNDYIQADPASTSSISVALQTFLQRASTSAARFTY